MTDATMSQTLSVNVALVYGLLLIDLLVNITDNLPVASPNQNQNYYWLVAAAGRSAPNGHPRSWRRVPIISPFTFATILIQILAIAFVVISLALRFFNVADRVRQSAWLLVAVQQQDNSMDSLSPTSRGNAAPASRTGRPVAGSSMLLLKSNKQKLQQQQQQQRSFLISPMPQRTALKLVLDRYWWSLVVGLTYLVLTIILQTNKIDSQRWTVPIAGIEPTAVDDERPPPDAFGATTLGPTTTTNETAALLAPAATSQRQADVGSLVPVLIVLIHKLMSTCYYVSFVVVYRASPLQMANRVLAMSSKHSTTSKPVGSGDSQ
jgi:hypothetical protein